MQIYESNYLSLFFHKKENRLDVIWSADTEKMTDEEFRNELLQYADLAEKYNPDKSLADTSNFLMTVSPETQHWIYEKVHPRSLAAGIKKFAYLVSKDYFSQVSIEQTMEEGNTSEMFSTKFFDNKETALEWLNK